MADMIETLFRDIRNIVMSSEIKYNKEAMKYETVDSRREADRYIFAKNKEDVFTSYVYYSVEAIHNAGITDPETAIAFSKDRSLIPYEWRDSILKEQRRLIVKNYVEKNDYYRTLNGLPEVEDILDIFVDDNIAEKYSLDSSIPIHKMSREDIMVLTKKGELDKIIAKYPTKKYLNYLGDRKIDIVRARSANNFSILRIDLTTNESIIERFVTIYDQCREYFMSVIYNSNFGNSYALYDNFIALMIMIMTIQRMVSQTFKMGVNRDFYDLQSFQMLFEMYNVPFLKELPIEYQRVLARNVNKLLMYKSTDKVIFDICEILGFSRISVFKHYLVKEHMFDGDKPVFLYKEVENPDGTTSLVEDVENMYKLYFQPVELREKNVFSALNDQNKRISYEVNTIDDEYWWDDDEELRKLLYESDFNYVESKYMSINAMYKLTEMIFEITYIFRLIIDKKIDTEKAFMKLPQLFGDKDIDIFKVIILLSSLICKKSGMKGNIISSPTKVITILGFNFKENIRKVREDILNNPGILDNDLLDYIEYMDIDKIADVNTLFTNIKGFNDFIIEKLGRSQNLEEYRAYEKIYRTLLITQESNEAFKMSNGSTAETYAQYLADVDSEIGMFLDNIDMSKIDEYIMHILYRLEMIVPNLKYLYTLNDTDTGIFRALIKLIKFFKSYTVELKDFNILYVMDNRYYNMIKLIGDIKIFEKNLYHEQPLVPKLLLDSLLMSLKLNGKDFVETINKIAVTGRNIITDSAQVTEDINHLYKTVDNETRMQLLDMISKVKENLLRDYFPYKEKPILLGLLLLKEMIDIKDVSYSKVSTTLYDTMLNSFNDGYELTKFNQVILDLESRNRLSGESSFEDSHYFEVTDSNFTRSIIYENDSIKPDEFLSMVIFNTIKSLVQTYNSIYSIGANFDTSDIISIKDSHKVTHSTWDSDHIKIADKLSALVGNILTSIMSIKSSFEIISDIDDSDKIEQIHSTIKDKSNNILQSFVLVDGLTSVINNHYKSKISMSHAYNHKSSYNKYDWLPLENSLGKTVWNDVVYTIDLLIETMSQMNIRKTGRINDGISFTDKSSMSYLIDKSDNMTGSDILNTRSDLKGSEEITIDPISKSIFSSNSYEDGALNMVDASRVTNINDIEDRQSLIERFNVQLNNTIESVLPTNGNITSHKTVEDSDKIDITIDGKITGKSIVKEDDSIRDDINIASTNSGSDNNELKHRDEIYSTNKYSESMSIQHTKTIDNRISTDDTIKNNDTNVSSVTMNTMDHVDITYLINDSKKTFDDTDDLQLIDKNRSEVSVYNDDNTNIIDKREATDKIISVIENLINSFIDGETRVEKQLCNNDRVKMRDILKVIYN